jgi:transposase InsO family protein
MAYKDEYLNDSLVTSIEEARMILARSVSLYNEDRPHMSIGNLYPSMVHEQKIQTERLWKNYYKKNPTIVNQYQD